MAHNIDFSNGRANMAFLGDRKDIWHKLGTQMAADMSIAEWRKAAGLDWHADMVPAFADRGGGDRPISADGWKFVVRNDANRVLGCVSDRYQPVQPADVLDWFERYIRMDSRFALDVAGSLKGGEIIWATAKYNGDLAVAGDRHTARLLMTTTLDGSGSTINRATMTRVVCNNTLDCALADKAKSVVRTRHSTKFDGAKVGRELAAIAQGFEHYKAMGDAMARVHLDDKQLFSFFRNMLGIADDAKTSDDVSGRKLNQLRDVCAAYKTTVAEGAEPGTAWAALNAVTRYVDHDRGSDDEKRFVSAQFGSGAQLKAQAVAYLTDDALLAAVSAKTASAMSDADLLRSVAAASGPLNSMR